MDLRTALNIVQIIVSVVLIAIILMQTKGSGLGTVFGGSDTSIYRTRRGLEKRLFQFTILLSIVFVGLSILSSAFGAASLPAGPLVP